jgi:copper homeostasis protein
LNPNKTIDFDRMKLLIELARPMRVVCHKAFDETPIPDEALDTLIALGVDEVLTSGHCKTAVEGAS